MNNQNTVDDSGRSWYVLANGQSVAGPFGSESYAQTVRDRLADQWDAPTVEPDSA